MPYFEKGADEKNIKQWSSLIGPENVLIFENPKAVIDVMLGAIALSSKTRTLNQYIVFGKILLIFLVTWKKEANPKKE
jgi:hypothetical protein